MKLRIEDARQSIEKVKEYMSLFFKNTLRDLKTVIGKFQEYPLVSIFFICAIFFLFLFPYVQVDHWKINNATEEAKLENEYRSTLAQILGGVAIGTGLYFTWKKLLISQDGQITERFTRAVDQLGAFDQNGNPALEIRLGGIYALERVSKESNADYWPIMEILTAYVRKNSPTKRKLKGNNQPIGSVSIDIQDEESTKSEVLEIKKLPLDIEAIIAVIRKRKKFLGRGEPNPLNLKEVCFQGANLYKTKLINANLEGANLREANLMEAKLMLANLKGARLEKAKILWADLRQTKLIEANLEGANLKEANLLGANLAGACLKGAYVKYADFLKANLAGADFTDVDLREGEEEPVLTDVNKFHNFTIEQLSTVKTLYGTQLDEELRKELEKKYPDKYQALIKKPN